MFFRHVEFLGEIKLPRVSGNELPLNLFDQHRNVFACRHVSLKDFMLRMPIFVIASARAGEGSWRDFIAVVVWSHRLASGFTAFVFGVGLFVQLRLWESAAVEFFGVPQKSYQVLVVRTTIHQENSYKNLCDWFLIGYAERGDDLR